MSFDPGEVRLRRGFFPEAFAAVEKVIFPNPWRANAFTQGDNKIHLSLWLGDTCLGFVFGAVIAGEAELWRIAVRPDQGRKGLGTRLLAEFLWALKEAGAEKVFLEVSHLNQGALALYRKFGFTQHGRRDHYYNRNHHALIMGRLLDRDILESKG